MPRSKTKSLALIARLQKQLAATEKQLQYLEKILPLYTSLSPAGRQGLRRYGWALEDLKQAVRERADESSLVSD